MSLIKLSLDWNNLVTSQLGTGKPITFFTVYIYKFAYRIGDAGWKGGRTPHLDIRVKGGLKNKYCFVNTDNDKI
jgi:hypothetical protein